MYPGQDMFLRGGGDALVTEAWRRSGAADPSNYRLLIPGNDLLRPGASVCLYLYTRGDREDAPWDGGPSETVEARGETRGDSLTLSIGDALRLGERASDVIAVARADVDRARAQTAGARAGYYPTVTGSAGYQRSLRSEWDGLSLVLSGMSGSERIDLPFGQRNTWRLGVIASQPIFDGFRTAAVVEQAQANERGAALGVQSSRAQVARAVAIAYYDAALAQRQVEIAEATLQQAAETLREAELGLQQGSTTEFDAVRARVARDNQSTSLVQFRTQRDVALVVLRYVLGLPLDRELTLASPLVRDDLEELAALVRTASGLGPEPAPLAVAQAKEAVAARAAAVAAARADRWPVIAAGTDLGFVAYQSTPFSDAWRTNWTVGLTLSVPLFDGGRRAELVASARGALAAAQAELDRATKLVAVEAARAAAAVTASRATLETSDRTVAQARRAYEIAELRFQKGYSTHLELVDARVQLEQALLNQARSARDLRVARVEQALLAGLPLEPGAAP